MLKKIAAENDKSVEPVYLDSDQIQELDKLIDILKKEIVHPGKKTAEHSASRGAVRD